MKRLLAAGAILAVAALPLTACGTTEPVTRQASSAGAVTLTDATGTTVHLDAPAAKVVGTEWNAVEDLVSLGITPAGVADVKGYRDWDSAVPLKGSPTDIGKRNEPSTDKIAALAPDLIVTTTDLPASAVTQFRRIAPTLVIESAKASDQLGVLKQNLDLIARATGRTGTATSVWQRFESTLAAARKKLARAGLAGQHVAFADGYVTADKVTLRPYTAGSALGTVNTQLGLANAWSVRGDKAYGLGSTDVEGLTALPADTTFLYIENDADSTTPFTTALRDNRVWTSLPFVQSGDTHRLPDGIWMFGGPDSMAAYADAVVSALTK
ncbi:ABC transporter substrate-binding protein [Actinocatenispora thailandica]|uniref:ABC transporter substrate-binding protein n=1 Tax=Actinocatenispora thailandica TaxID=227318 RepID=A0A7R7HVJ8_9ACTN|nr:iron-siderophore ABC transporter substrate-binding protein [Actinocatenispora thailandica]BCJ34237.1 ABC transporter substrate-binding protein [Actinocatenispora thailandica]